MTAVDPITPDPRRWRALAVCVTALFMTLLDASIVNVALPSIGLDTGAGPSELQWIVSGYLLAFGMVPIIGGRLGDDRGRKRMLLIGIAGFVATSAVAGLAPDAKVLIAARLVQGLAGGLINPQVAGLIQQMFPRAERGRAFGLIGTAVGVATATGPVVGGLVITVGGTHIGWRLTFLINLPVGLAAFVLCWLWLPTPPRSGLRRQLDLPGVALLAVAVFGLLFPAVRYNADQDWRLTLVAIPALVVLAGFAAWERGPARRRGHPLIDTGLFAIRSYADGLGLALLYFVAYTGSPLVLSLFLQEGLGFSPLHSGLTACAYAIGTAVSAPIGGRYVATAGRRILVVALILFVVGIAIAAVVAYRTSGRLGDTAVALCLLGPLLLAGLGGGSVITPNQALSLADVDVRGGSTAGGMLQTSQRVGAAVGTAVISAVFYAAASSAGPLHGAARSAHYGRAYAAALLVTVAFALAALALAIREARRSPSPTAPSR